MIESNNLPLNPQQGVLALFALRKVSIPLYFQKILCFLETTPSGVQVLLTPGCLLKDLFFLLLVLRELYEMLEIKTWLAACKTRSLLILLFLTFQSFNLL